MGRFLRFALVFGAGALLVHQYPELRRYLKLSRMQGVFVCLAIPGRILHLLDEPGLALIEVAGVRRKVNVELLRDEGLAPDDWVLIHVGFAMSKISAADADEQMRLLTMLGEDQLAQEEMQGYRFG